MRDCDGGLVSQFKERKAGVAQLILENNPLRTHAAYKAHERGVSDTTTKTDDVLQIFFQK